jgi:hypothetical protein
MKSHPVRLLIALVAATAFTFVGCKSYDDHDHDHSGHSHGTAAKPYPLKKCIVSDDAFDHGKPVVFVHEGQEIKLCCEDCRKDFDKDPAKFLGKLAAK